MNLVLYRKYRPQKFGEVIGQEDIIKTITNEISTGKISHAYLFAGPRGCGKTTTARLIAKSLNCQKRKKGEFEPCNQCSNCQEIKEGSFLDLIEIDAASNRGIDEIRELREGINFVPAKSKYKVFIIDEAHQLTREAANALLKTLEEPPSYAVFILATTEPQKMIPTILSRCQRFYFKRVTNKEIEKRLITILKKEKISFEKEAIELIAFSAEGSVRDAETLLDQVISLSEKNITKNSVEKILGLAPRELTLTFLQKLKKNQAKEAIEYLNELVFLGIDLKEFTKSLIYYLRDLLILKINPQLNNPLLSSSEKERKSLVSLLDGLKAQEIKLILEKFIEAEQKMKYSPILQLPLELAIIEICQEKEY